MKRDFVSNHGHSYGYDGWVDQHWWGEVGQRLGPAGTHYLDHTGG